MESKLLAEEEKKEENAKKGKKEDEEEDKEEDKEEDEEEDKEEKDSEEDEEENKEEDKEEDEDKDTKKDKTEDIEEDEVEDEEEDEKRDEKQDEKKNIEEDEEENKEEDEEEDEKEDKENNEEEDKKKDKEEDEKDDKGKYVFFEDQNPSGNPPFLHLHATHNHVILIDMEKNYFSPTSTMQANQRLILKFMYFLLIYKLVIHIAASPIYSSLAISSIYPKDVNWMQDSLFFPAKYSAFIYCNVLYTIDIPLCEYLIQDFEDATLLLKTLTDIIKRFTNTYCKNTVPFILSHPLFLRLFAFGIHNEMSYPPSITILDKKKALI